MQLQLSKEEYLRLNLIAEKKKNISIQDALLTSEWNKIVEDFCKRNSADFSKARSINLESGMIEFEDEKKPDKKKKSGKGTK